MIPAEEELPVFPEDMEDETPEVKIKEDAPDMEETMFRVAKAMEEGLHDPGGYHVTFTRWTKGKGHGRVVLEKHVQISRAILRELLIMRGIMREFEEDKG